MYLIHSNVRRRFNNSSARTLWLACRIYWWSSSQSFYKADDACHGIEVSSTDSQSFKTFTRKRLDKMARRSGKNPSIDRRKYLWCSCYGFNSCRRIGWDFWWCTGNSWLEFSPSIKRTFCFDGKWRFNDWFIYCRWRYGFNGTG